MEIFDKFKRNNIITNKIVMVTNFFFDNIISTKFTQILFEYLRDHGPTSIICIWTNFFYEMYRYVILNRTVDGIDVDGDKTSSREN